MKKQKWAYIQHPMWLVIREDPRSAEATPPWGAATTEEYAKRVGRNLAIIENNPEVRLNYEFGAYELEDLAAKHPDLYDRMKRMVASGQLYFVNGTYNQPHGQAMSLEANIRHLQHGIRTYKQLFGVDVITHAVQEPDYTNQTPQLLRGFGFSFAAYGAFLHDLISPLGAGPEPSLLFRWVGLDGSDIPLAVDQNGQGVNYDRRIPPELQERENFVNFRIPDMDEFEVHPGREYVGLDDALDKQYRECAPVVEARLQLPWSYIEGTDGESLMRAIGRCEEALIEAETLASLTNTEFREKDLCQIWERWLQAHHHDALWHGAPGLRAASIRWCAEAEDRARSTSRVVLEAQPEPDGAPAVRITTVYPAAHRGVVKLDWAGEIPELLRGPDGEQILVQTDPSTGETPRILVPYTAAGIEDLVLIAEGAGHGNSSNPLDENVVFANDFYEAEVTPYGGIARAYSRDGRELMRNTGTRTLASTTAGLGKLDEGQGWTKPEDTHLRYGLDAAGALTVVQNGRMHAYATSGYKSRLIKGPVADVVVSHGMVGDVSVDRRTYLYHALPWIEMEMTCHFDETVIDEYSEDANKLCIWWPYFYRDMIENGIPGGSEPPSRPEIGFLPVSWFDVDHRASGTGGGYAVASAETLKTFRRAGRIGTVLAWGDDQGHFNNRNEALIWRNTQDLKLRGDRTYRFFIYPHAAGWRDAGVPGWAMARLRPPVTKQTASKSASRASWLSLATDSLVATSVRRTDEGSLRVRFYEAGGRRIGMPQARLFGTDATFTVQDLSGKELSGIDAFRIGELIF